MMHKLVEKTMQVLIYGILHSRYLNKYGGDDEVENMKLKDLEKV